MPEATLSDLVQSPQWGGADQLQREIAVNRWLNKRLKSANKGFGTSVSKQAMDDLRVNVASRVAAGEDPSVLEAAVNEMVSGGKPTGGAIDNLRRAANRSLFNMRDTTAAVADYLNFEQFATGMREVAESGLAATEYGLSDKQREALKVFDWADLKPGSGWWTTELAEAFMTSLPIMLPQFGAAGAASLATAGMSRFAQLGFTTAAGALTGAGTNSIFNAAEVYNQVLTDTGDRDKAGKAAEKVFLANAPASVVTNAAETAIMFGAFKKAMPKPLRGGILEFVGRSFGSGVVEGTEELIETGIQQAGMEWAKTGIDKGFFGDLFQGIANVNPLSEEFTNDDFRTFVTGAIIGIMADAPFSAHNIRSQAQALSEDISGPKLNRENVINKLNDLIDQVNALPDEEVEEFAARRGIVPQEGDTPESLRADLIQDFTQLAQQTEAIADGAWEMTSEVATGTQASINALQTTQDEGVTVRAVSPVEGNPASKTLDDINKVSAAPVHFVAGVDSEGHLTKLKGIDGAIVEGGAILVDVGAEGSYARIILHEVTHKLKETDPDLYEELKTVALRDTKGFNAWLDSLNKAREEQGEEALTAEEAKDSELVSDFVGRFAIDRRMFNRLAVRKPAVAKESLSKVQRVLRKITNILGGNQGPEPTKLRGEIEAILNKAGLKLDEGKVAENQAGLDELGDSAKRVRDKIKLPQKEKLKVKPRDTKDSPQPEAKTEQAAQPTADTPPTTADQTTAETPVEEPITKADLKIVERQYKKYKKDLKQRIKAARDRIMSERARVRDEAEQREFDEDLRWLDEMEAREEARLQAEQEALVRDRRTPTPEEILGAVAAENVGLNAEPELRQTAEDRAADQASADEALAQRAEARRAERESAESFVALNKLLDALSEEFTSRWDKIFAGDPRGAIDYVRGNFDVFRRLRDASLKSDQGEYTSLSEMILRDAEEQQLIRQGLDSDLDGIFKNDREGLQEFLRQQSDLFEKFRREEINGRRGFTRDIAKSILREAKRYRGSRRKRAKKTRSPNGQVQTSPEIVTTPELPPGTTDAEDNLKTVVESNPVTIPEADAEPASDPTSQDASDATPAAENLVSEFKAEHWYVYDGDGNLHSGPHRLKKDTRGIFEGNLIPISEGMHALEDGSWIVAKGKRITGPLVDMRDPNAPKKLFWAKVVAGHYMINVDGKSVSAKNIKTLDGTGDGDSWQVIIDGEWSNNVDTLEDAKEFAKFVDKFGLEDGRKLFNDWYRGDGPSVENAAVEPEVSPRSDEALGITRVTEFKPGWWYVYNYAGELLYGPFKFKREGESHVPAAKAKKLDKGEYEYSADGRTYVLATGVNVKFAAGEEGLIDQRPEYDPKNVAAEEPTSVSDRLLQRIEDAKLNLSGPRTLMSIARDAKKAGLITDEHMKVIKEQRDGAVKDAKKEGDTAEDADLENVYEDLQGMIEGHSYRSSVQTSQAASESKSLYDIANLKDLINVTADELLDYARITFGKDKLKYSNPDGTFNKEQAVNNLIDEGKRWRNKVQNVFRKILAGEIVGDTDIALALPDADVMRNWMRDSVLQELAKHAGMPDGLSRADILDAFEQARSIFPESPNANDAYLGAMSPDDMLIPDPDNDPRMDFSLRRNDPKVKALAAAAYQTGNFGENRLAAPVSNRDVFAAVDTASAETDTPTARPKEVVMSEANAVIQKMGMPAIIAKLKAGDTMDLLLDTLTEVMKRAYDSLSVGLAPESGMGRIKDVVTLSAIYKDERSDMGRGLQYGRERHENLASAASYYTRRAIFSAPSDTAKQIEAALRSGDKEEFARLVEKEAARVQDLLKNLAKAGTRLDRVNWHDMSKVFEIFRQIKGETRSTRPTSPDSPIYEFWINSILSGIQTIGANITGFGYAMYDTMAVRPFAVAAETTALTKSLPEGLSAGAKQLYYSFKGMAPRLAQMHKIALQSWDYEHDAFLIYLGSEKGMNMPEVVSAADVNDVLRQEVNPGAIKGKTGRAIRYPTRVMTWADSWMRQLAFWSSIGYQAHIIGMRKHGLRGDALSDYVAQQVADPHSEAAIAALNMAQEYVYQNRHSLRSIPVLGGVITQIEAGRSQDSIYGMFNRFVFPFVNTPGNLIRIGLGHMTPLGVPLGIAKYRNTLRKGGFKSDGTSRSNSQHEWVYNHKSEVTKDMINQLIVNSVFLSFMFLAGEDDNELPMITGTGPSFRNSSEKTLKDITTPPMSFRLGDTWYSYRRLDPIASAIAFTVDISNSLKRALNGQDPEENIERLSQNLMGQFKDKTYLKAVGDILKIFDDPSRYSMTWATNIGVGFVPTIVRQAGMSMDEYLRETRPFDFKDRVIDRPLQRALPFGGVVDRPNVKIGPLGEPLEKGSGVHPASDWAWRMINPARSQVGTDKVIYRMLWNFNDNNPNDQYYMSVPMPKITDSGTEYELTDDQYERYLRLRGEQIMKRWESYERFSTPDYANPKERDILALKKIVGKAQKFARSKMLRELRRSK